MADDQYIPVVDARVALRAVNAAIEVRRGYLALIDQLLAPHPIGFQHDQKKRNQMITLLSRSDTLWVLYLIYAESPSASTQASHLAFRQRREILGTYLTRATLAKGIAVYETGDLQAKPERRHVAAAGRIVEAGLSYGLLEERDKPDEKQKPIVGTNRLSEFLHKLGDHAYWTMKDAINDPAQLEAGPLSGFREDPETFERDDLKRLSREGRVTSSDAAMMLVDVLS